MLAANNDLLQNRMTLNGEIHLLEMESREIMSIWLHKKGDFLWDPKDPHTEDFM